MTGVQTCALPIFIRDIVVSATPILYVTGIKWVVERPRPVTSIGSGLLPGDPSFPSGHTAAAVIVSVMMILTVRNWARKRFSDAEWDRMRVFHRRSAIGAVALVFVVACSRLLLGLHFPTDVITSAVPHGSTAQIGRASCRERVYVLV